MRVKNLAIYLFLYIISFALIASAFIDSEREIDISWVETVVVFASFFFLFKYLIYMIISPWYDVRWSIWKARNAEKVNSYQPKVSVIIPAWNEEVGILSTVKSVLDNSYPNIEVIVINDGSTDGSDLVMKNFLTEFEMTKRQDGKTLIYEYKENGGKGRALNRGIELSTGEIIVSIDADCITHKDAIKNFVVHFADEKVMAAVGNVKIGNTSSILATIQYLEFLFSFYFKRADSVLGSIYIIGGAAGAFRKEVFDKIGVYSLENITEDIELSVRIQDKGMKIAYAANAVVYTEGASDLKGLMKQRLRWKKGRMDTFLKYRKLFFSTSSRHNKFLSWFVLPFAVLGDSQLLVELPLIIFLYVVAMITHDYSAFLSALLIVSFVFLIQVFTSDHKYNRHNIYVLAPIGWLMFYVVTIVEINALFKSLASIYTKKEIKWQSWKRTGIENKEL